MGELMAAAPGRQVVLSTWLRRALWPVTLVAGLAAESVLWRAGTLPLYLVFDLAVGLTVVAVSFAVWEAHPGNWTGPLLLANSVWFLCSPVRYIASPFWISLSWVAEPTVSVIFAHLVLAYPGGRLTSRPDRVFVAVAYAYAVAFPVAELMIAPASDLFGDCLTGPCPATPPLLTANPGLFDRLQPVGNGLDAVLVAWLLLLVGRRLARSSQPRRRQFLPIAVLAVVVTAGILADTFMPQNAGGAWNVRTLLDHGVELAIALTFFASLYASRMSRSQVADLLARLAGAEPDEVQALLSQVLHDPRLRLGLWDHAGGGYLDATGRPLTVPPAGQERVATTISGADGPLGVLVHDQAVLDDPRLMSAVLAGTRLALENEQLHARLRARLADVQASRARLVRAEDEARRRLERDLHDGAQQRLLSIGLALQLARKEVADGSGAAELLDESQSELVAAIEELRNLAQGIHPTVLTEQGLAAAVTALARRLAVPVEVAGIGARLPGSVETTAYFLICEALQNTVKHAQASRARIGVTEADGVVVVEVSDDGTGGADTGAGAGSGLRGLRDRVEAVGGRLKRGEPAGPRHDGAGGAAMRVVIADDALLIREGLTRVLASCGIEVAGSAGNVSGLLDAIDEHHPDAAIVDIRMPPDFSGEGLRAAERLAVSHPDLAVLILSQYAEPAFAATLLADSPARRGYLLKERVLHPDHLVSALYRIAAGHTVVDPAVIDAAMSTATTNHRLAGLSARELEVLHLLAQGLTDRGICDRLVLSPRTVASHVRHIFTKLALPGGDHDNRRVHAVLIYLNDTAGPRGPDGG